MSTHKTSGRWRLGLALAFLATLLWGLLPIALKDVVAAMDAYTITWYRFLVAAGILAAVAVGKGRGGELFRLRGASKLLLILAAVGLTANYVVYLLGLEYLSPSASQVIIQMAPMFLLLGSFLFFKERFRFVQWTGFLLLTAGLVLFFNQRYGAFIEGERDLLLGVLLILAAGVLWAVYALSQKQLLKEFSSSHILFLIYLAGVFVYLPFIRPGDIGKLDTAQVLLLAFCALNTLFAYGSFAEALNHLEASRISVVLSVAPLITIGAMALAAGIFPGRVLPENLNALSLIGAALVVGGSMMGALGKRKKKE